MNVLLIGSGGREHAIAWKLRQSAGVSKLYAAPGNPGIAQMADCVDVAVTDAAAIEKFARANDIGLVVIGPEDPLAAGLTDRLQAAGLRVFGPTKQAARLEGDKWFAKELMASQAIPTADARAFTDVAAAEQYVRGRGTPIVIKAAGLAKGKGVTVAYREADAIDAIHQCLKQRVFGDAGTRVVIEDFLTGPEVSVLAFVDGRNIYVMESSQDHKTIDEGDTGPMTGGMGAYSPTPMMTDAILAQVERDVFVPVLDGLAREGTEYRGVLYAGLMLTAAGPRVLEFNCRFGDPETQPLMMRLKSDLLSVFDAVIDGTLDRVSLEWDSRPAICVVASSANYPATPRLGDVITGVDAADAMADVKVFHSGTARNHGALVTAGGRVLAVTALGDTLKNAQTRCYGAMDKIKFDGKHFRRDIGYRALREG
ncbi:MAG TPA: phosphoribosylamine--glycine ligase [Tepidisphaeraceae bacterium]|jgi:phosphoribosylamine--glycine ligase